MPVTRTQAHRPPNGLTSDTGYGLPPVPAPPAWGANPFSIQVSASNGVDAFYNAHFFGTDYSTALNTLSKVYNSTATPVGDGANAVIKGHRFLSIGPANTPAQFTQALTSAITFPNICDGVVWGDETTQVASKLLNGWVQLMTAGVTTLAAAMGAADTSMQVVHPTYSQSTGFSVSGNFTIQLDNGGGNVEQVNIGTVTQNSPSAGIDTWSGLTRGVNNPPGGVGGGSSPSYNAAAHVNGLTVQCVVNDIGATAAKAFVTAFNVANGSSLLMQIVLLGAAIQSLGTTDLANIMANADLALYQSQKLLSGQGTVNVGPPPTITLDVASIQAYAALAGTYVQKLRTAIGGGKRVGIQVQQYDPTARVVSGVSQLVPYDTPTMLNIVNYVGQIVAPTWMNLWFLSFITNMEATVNGMTGGR